MLLPNRHLPGIDVIACSYLIATSPVAYAACRLILRQERDAPLIHTACHPPGYCSAFHDVDRYFGSFGSFYEFWPKRGCYEANPPFDKVIIIIIIVIIIIIIVIIIVIIINIIISSSLT